MQPAEKTSHKRPNRSVLIAIIFATIAFVWILSGQFEEPETLPAKKQATEYQLTKVEVKQSMAESKANELVLRGRTGYSRQVELKSEAEGTVNTIKAERGIRVKKGQALFVLDIDDRYERLSQAEAKLRELQSVYEASKKLAKEGFRSSTQLAAAEANIREAEANVIALKLEIQNTKVQAPFDGVLNDRMVEEGDFVKVGDIVAEIVDLDPLYVLAEANEDEVAKFSVGQVGLAAIPGHESLQGKIHYIAVRGKEQTRTFPLELEIPNPNHAIPAGLTAEIKIKLNPVMAHNISPAILTLSDDGIVGVKTVNEDNMVAFNPVEIVDDAPNGTVWISGLPQMVRLVVVGQEFIKPGEKVIPTYQQNISQGQQGQQGQDN